MTKEESELIEMMYEIAWNRVGPAASSLSTSEKLRMGIVAIVADPSFLAAHDAKRDEELVEGIARYIFVRTDEHDDRPSWDAEDEKEKDTYRREARRAIKSAREAKEGE